MNSLIIFLELFNWIVVFLYFGASMFAVETIFAVFRTCPLHQDWDINTCPKADVCTQKYLHCDNQLRPVSKGLIVLPITVILYSILSVSIQLEWFGITASEVESNDVALWLLIREYMTVLILLASTLIARIFFLYRVNHVRRSDDLVILDFFKSKLVERRKKNQHTKNKRRLYDI